MVPAGKHRQPSCSSTALAPRPPQLRAKEPNKYSIRVSNKDSSKDSKSEEVEDSELACLGDVLIAMLVQDRAPLTDVQRAQSLVILERLMGVGTEYGAQLKVIRSDPSKQAVKISFPDARLAWHALERFRFLRIYDGCFDAEIAMAFAVADARALSNTSILAVVSGVGPISFVSSSSIYRAMSAFGRVLSVARDGKRGQAVVRFLASSAAQRSIQQRLLLLPTSKGFCAVGVVRAMVPRRQLGSMAAAVERGGDPRDSRDSRDSRDPGDHRDPGRTPSAAVAAAACGCYKCCDLLGFGELPTTIEHRA